jgi:hypothetical protein
MLPFDLVFLSLPLVVAQLPPPESPMSVGWVVLALAAAAVAYEKITGGIINTRKLKGADPEHDARYVARGEFEAVKEQTSRLEGQIASIQLTVNNDMRAVHRALGRIEGALGTSPVNQNQGGTGS